jgi:hypothetical protein
MTLGTFAIVGHAASENGKNNEINQIKLPKTNTMQGETKKKKKKKSSPDSNQSISTM